MSYILDALKKSDQERKRGDVPGLQTVHIPLTVEQKSPRLLYVFIVLLLISLAFVVGLLVKDRGTITETSSVESVSPSVLSLDNQTTKKAPAQAQVQPQAEPREVSPRMPEPVQPQPLAKPVMPEKTPAVTAEVTIKQSVNESIDIPYLHELPEYQQQSVPKFEFAGHVYSSSPFNRSVIINGAAMSEGDTIIQGIKLEQITPSGVIFSLHGEKFRIDVLQDWSFE